MSSKHEILFSPSPVQLRFLQAVFSFQHRYILFGGAIRGGKTFAGLGALLLLCKAFPGSRWAIVRDTLQTLKRTTIPSFHQICPRSFVASYHQDTQVVTFTNGSQIIFFGENYDEDKELNRWKGLEVNGFLLEEANELQEVAFYKAIERAGTFIPKGKKPQPLVLLTCNPAQNWVKTLFYNRHKADTLPPEFLYIPSRITDNPYIMADEAYVQSLQNLPRYQYEVFVNGNWDIQLKEGGEFYKCFEPDIHVGKCAYDPALPLHISWDDNVNPYLPLGVFQIKGGTRIEMIDEIACRNPHNTVRHVCAEFARRYQGHAAGLFVYGDATARKADTKLEAGNNFYRLVCDYLADFRPTLRVPAANAGVAMRGNFMNTILEKELYGISIMVDEKCTKTINDFVLLKEAADGTKSKETETDPVSKVRYQKVGHFTDLTDYFVCTAFAAEYARYLRGGTPTRFTQGSNYNKYAY